MKGKTEFAWGEMLRTLSVNEKKSVAIVILTAITATVCWLAGLNSAQIASVSIFTLEIYATLMLWAFRLPIAFIAIFSLLALGLIDIPRLIEFANFDVILFLIGMMSIIGVLEENHFFEYLIDKVIRLVGEKTERLILVLMFASAIFAALVDEVTSILFMTATIIHLTLTYGVNPVPFVMMIVFATNIGSSATVVGNPVGVMVALKGGLSFSDFIRWATPIAIISLVWTVFISMKIFSKEIKELSEKLRTPRPSLIEEPTPPSEGRIRLCWIIFLMTILGLVFHSSIEGLLHLEKNTMLIGTGLLFAGISLLWERERAHEIVERRIDWWTLTFFLLLFASVGTLNYVGVTNLLAKGIYNLFMGSEIEMFLFFTWLVGILSAFMDNVLAVATFIPIVQDLGALGVYNFPLWWGMLFAATFFGNLTLIGSTANIVAIGMLERRQKITITFMQWLKVGAVISIQTLAIATILIILQLPFMPR